MLIYNKYNNNNWITTFLKVNDRLEINYEYNTFVKFISIDVQDSSDAK